MSATPAVEWRQRLLIFLVPLFLSLPFINRAYFVDDGYFVEIATWLKEHPGQPYHFRADDAGHQTRGWEEDGFVRMVNPLFHHYYLAFLMKVGGERPWFLRLGCVLLSCFSALFIFGLARRLTSFPVLATLLVLVTPAHWLSAHSLLIDSTAGFLFMGALYLFIRGAEKDSIGFLLGSGLFMGGAFVSKYPSLLVVPLTLTWLFLRRKKLTRRWIYLIPTVLGLLLLTAYQLWTLKLYGRPHILAASARMVGVFGWTKGLVFLVFFSGVTLAPLLAWGTVTRSRQIIYALLLTAFTLFFSSRVGGFSVAQGFQMALWLVTGLVFFIAYISFRKTWVYPRDHFLFVWVGGFMAMMYVVMGWVAARYYVIVVPAVVFAASRLVEFKWRHRAPQILRGTLAFTFLFTFFIAYADYRQAGSARQVAQDLKAKGYIGGPRHFYLGDSFTISYLKQEGWTPCFETTVFQPGDLVVAHEVTMPLIWFYRQPLTFREIDRFDYPTWCPVKVMHFRGSAGFYASVWGALPFTFYPGPWERFRLYEIVKSY